MNKGQTIFSKIKVFLPQKIFRQFVNRHNSNYRFRFFKGRFPFVNIDRSKFKETAETVEKPSIGDFDGFKLLISLYAKLS
jgi:hypothetical protein